MNQTMILAFEFVKSIPEKLENRILYVSMDYATAMHKCCCGCGREVVTPLSPTDWKLIYDGVSVSLSPSIGNWSFDCQSHYWIVENSVRWADKWSGEEIAAGRAHDLQAKDSYFTAEDKMGVEKVTRRRLRSGFWSRLWERLLR